VIHLALHFQLLGGFVELKDLHLRRGGAGQGDLDGNANDASSHRRKVEVGWGRTLLQYSSTKEPTARRKRSFIFCDQFMP
jgi:hypothetical protein